MDYAQKQQCIAQALQAAQEKLDELVSGEPEYEEGPGGHFMGKPMIRSRRILSSKVKAGQKGRILYLTFYERSGQWQLITRNYPWEEDAATTLKIIVSGDYSASYGEAVNPEKSLEGIILRPLLSAFKAALAKAASEIEEGKQ